MTQRNIKHAGKREGHHRTRRVGRLVAVVTCAALVIAGAVAVVVVKLSGPHSASSHPIKYLGVYEPGAPGTYSGVEQFSRDVGRQPNLVSYYSGWGEKFNKAFAETAANHGATTIVQMEPFGISLAKIAAGRYDSYLTSFADEVAAFRHNVIICFGHEMNGFWYSWGYHHTSPATFIAAWRHIVNLFRHRGAYNVTWLWQVNSLSSQTGPVHDWWPGPAYVTWVGVSGYYYLPYNTFDSVFDPVVTAVRQFTDDPVLIAETAVGPQAGQVRGIKNLFAGLRMQHDLGLVWFDQHSYGGLYKGEDWRLEGNPVALAAFRNALRG